LAITDTDRPVTIAIIGGGFCGTLTAIHLLRSESAKLNIHIINKGHALAKGVAYEPHTNGLLLNVPNGRMSAFPDYPDHYLLWVSKYYTGKFSSENIHNEFSPRKFYGMYLTSLLKEATELASINKTINFHDNYAGDICDVNGFLQITLQDGSNIIADKIVLATGNEKPRLPNGVSKKFEKSLLYHANPWAKACLKNADQLNDVLIIGAGLTTVDTVIGLIENGFKGTIHTISPNGYRLKPWKEDKAAYTGAFIDSINESQPSLLQLLNAFNKHRKIAAKLNQSVYPLVDSLRPYVQKLWQGFSLQEKQQFISYIKPFWEKVRHRLPCEQHKRMENLFNNKKLVAHKGRIVSITESANKATTVLNIDGKLQEFNFDSVINCTGPETDIRKINDVLLTNLSNKGWISPGPCDLGINACPDTGNIINTKGDIIANISVIGNHLKGVLWESTAIPELRVQAKKMADHLIANLSSQIRIAAAE
jgi:uncharacterized NAD(P)/FAD-binding protein YdhS